MDISRKFRARLLEGEPHPIDVHVGRRLCKLRHNLHISQTALADKIGLTFQQIQKYEKGENRLSCSRLWMICEAMEINVSSFFVGIDAPTLRKSRRWLEKLSEEKMNKRQWEAAQKWEAVEEKARQKAAAAKTAISKGETAASEGQAAAAKSAVAEKGMTQVAAKSAAAAKSRVKKRAAASDVQPRAD